MKTQIAIIRTLFDGETKSQRQIANMIEREESTVSKAISYLERTKVVEIKSITTISGKKNIGSYKNNACRLTYHIDNGINILQFIRNVFYSKRLKVHEADDLVQYLHKEEMFFDVIINNHMELINHCKIEDDLNQRNSMHRTCETCLKQLNEPPLCGINDHERKQCIEYLKNPKQISHKSDSMLDEADKILIKYRKSIQKELRTEFKIRLKMSPYFFQICLIKTPEELMKEFNEIFRLTLDSHLHKNPYGIIYGGNELEGFIRAYLDKIFEICTIYDILNNKISPEAYRYVEEMNIQKAHVLEDIEKLDVQSYYENPDLLKWKYETAIKKQLHHKIKIDTKKIKHNLKLTNKSELNVFLKMNNFTDDEIELSHLLVGGLFKGDEIMKFEDIIIGLRRQGVRQHDTFIRDLLEKLRNTKRQDGSTNPVMDTVDFGNRWYCTPTLTKSNTQ